jgi:hypothetical protein
MSAIAAKAQQNAALVAKFRFPGNLTTANAVDADQ